jgi:hypothetical protein
MAPTSALLSAPAANSSDRTPVLPTARVRPVGSHPSSRRLSVFARRFVSALMRSLAAPHV